MPTVELRPAESSDRGYAEALLAESGLPTADLDFSSEGLGASSADPDSTPVSLFVCESDAGETVGVGGLEIRGDAGLLRSVAVEESARGRGYGTAICERLLDRARAADLDAVFLLTTTADDFFAELGFERIERERVPDSVRASAEFADLCPASATCMKISL